MDPTPLANAELAVMERLWDDSPQTARALREALYPGKGQHGTIQRLLQRLEEKGYVRRDKSLPVHLFAPAVERDAYAAGQVQRLADQLTGGSLAPLLTHLIDQKGLSGGELAKLRALLEARREADDPDRGGEAS